MGLAADVEPQAGEHEPADCARVQLTPALAGSLETVAVNCTPVEVSGIRALMGDTATIIAGMVTVAVPVAPLYATEVAVTVTDRLLAGGVAGPVYVIGVPLGVGPVGTEPHGAGEQETLKVTPLLVGSFVTLAMNCCVPVASTLALEGDTETVTPRT